MINTVLIAEHDQDVADLMITLLSKDGHRARLFSGDEIIPKDSLLIIDPEFSGGRGLAIAQKARAENPTLRVFVVSAIDTATDRQSAHSLGALHYLKKPFSGTEFRQLAANFTASLPVVPNIA